MRASERARYAIRIDELHRGKSAVAYYAHCDSPFCIGYHGAAEQYPEHRGVWTGRAYKYRGLAVRDAEQHCRLYHPDVEVSR